MNILHKEHPTVQVAIAQIEAHGIRVTPEVEAAICAVLTPASDDLSAERQIILSGELAQLALETIGGKVRQTVYYAPQMVVYMAGVARELSRKMGVGEEGSDRGSKP